MTECSDAESKVSARHRSCSTLLPRAICRPRRVRARKRNLLRTGFMGAGAPVVSGARGESEHVEGEGKSEGVERKGKG